MTPEEKQITILVSLLRSALRALDRAGMEPGLCHEIEQAIRDAEAQHGKEVP